MKKKSWSLRLVSFFALIILLTACPTAKLTSLFIRNNSDWPMTITITGEKEALFDQNKITTYLPKILKTNQLKSGACATGDTLVFASTATTNQLIIPANSTAEIIFPMYKILDIASNLSIQTSQNNIVKDYFPNQFNELFKPRKSIYYMDLE
jgi:hypothetical protein